MQIACGPVSVTAGEGCAVEAPWPLQNRGLATLDLQIRPIEGVQGFYSLFQMMLKDALSDRRAVV